MAPPGSLLAALSCAALLAGARGSELTATCADRTAAGLTGDCVTPFTFPANTTVGGYALPAAWLGPAPVCYTQYLQNQLATPTFMPRNSTCSAYANRGCCSSETVMSIDNADYGTTDPYPGYSSRCGPLSNACQAYFQAEACFYECDWNIGSFRKFPTCVEPTGDQNAWQIVNMPLSSTLVNNWWNACKNDFFCTGASGSYFDLPSLTCVPPSASGAETATCKKFSTIYANATDFITRLWDNSFSVAASGAPGYTFPSLGDAPFDGITVINPNIATTAALSRTNPPFCPFRTTVDGFAQAMSDFRLYISNMLLYTGLTYSGALYALPTTPTFAWWTPPSMAPPPPPPAACTSGAAARAVSATAVVALAAALLA